MNGFLDIDDYRLIPLVQEAPHLYDKNRADYNDEAKKDATWAEIAKELNASVSDVKARFKGLRSRLVRERRILSDISATGNVPAPTWCLYMEMAWLLQFVGNRRRRYHQQLKRKKEPPLVLTGEKKYRPIQPKLPVQLSMSVPVLHEGEIEEEVTIPVESIDSYDPLLASDTSPTLVNSDQVQQNKFSFDSSISSSLHTIAENMKVLAVPKRKKHLHEEDGDDIFGRLVASELKRCKDLRLKKEAKKKITDILFELD